MSKFKKGDIVDFTDAGWERYRLYFEDGIRSGLEIHAYISNSQYKLYQKDKRAHWYVLENYIVLSNVSDPKSWRRNKPMMVQSSQDNTDWFARHFSHVDSENRVRFYGGGKTSFTIGKRRDGTRQTLVYYAYREPTKEELA